MSLGIIMLVHDAFERAEQVARHWVKNGCPVVIHVDKNVDRKSYLAFRAALNGVEKIKFCKRYKCEWGMWGLVAASQSAAETILEVFPDVRHVYLSSGTCLPLRPIEELVEYLDNNPDTDFIESATIENATWTIDGLEQERFTLRFPFSWRKQRRFFDRYVKFQRRIGMRRRMPKPLVPHIGSQWWCLTRQTLSAILQNPMREKYDRFFRRVWIPDESYFQTLTRQYARKIESRSLTLTKFDFQGKPHIFYNDHLQLLRRSDCFVARKIWQHADRLYDSFLRDPETALSRAEPQPGKIDRLFSKATERRTRGRPGLVMQSCHPNDGWANGLSAQTFSVFEGFSDLFTDFEPWLGRVTNAQVHGHLFAADSVEFAGRSDLYKGCLSNSAELRDYNPHAFLRNFLWNSRGEHQIFQYGPFDTHDFHWEMVKDPNASFYVVSGAWLLRHFKQNADIKDICRDAALRHKLELDHVRAMRSPYAKAKVKIWTMAEFLEAPVDHLKTVVDDINPGAAKRLTELPRMVNLEGFKVFLKTLKNHGLHPHLLGDFQPDDANMLRTKPKPKPYLVR